MGAITVHYVKIDWETRESILKEIGNMKTQSEDYLFNFAYIHERLQFLGVYISQIKLKEYRKILQKAQYKGNYLYEFLIIINDISKNPSIPGDIKNVLSNFVLKYV